ncbi:MAG: DUF4126 domain-containing protein [Gemmataceae bacterium]|nr:DUF4126 domain-containing protein [Gemmataceae bacterium]
MASIMEAVLGVIVGIGLSAACGFRVFVPLLGMSIASMAGHLTLSAGFEWIASWPALIAFATATVLEIGTFYVPWLDNVMDAAAIPAATVAGTIATASQVGDMSPFLQWTLAVIAGGGVSLTVQGGTVVIRAASSAMTGGFGNFTFSTLELLAAVVFTVLAVVLPILCFVAVVAMCWQMLRLIARSPLLRRSRSSTTQHPCGP